MDEHLEVKGVQRLDPAEAFQFSNGSVCFQEMHRPMSQRAARNHPCLQEALDLRSFAPREGQPPIPCIEGRGQSQKVVRVHAVEDRAPRELVNEGEGGQDCPRNVFRRGAICGLHDQM